MESKRLGYPWTPRGASPGAGADGHWLKGKQHQVAAERRTGPRPETAQIMSPACPCSIPCPKHRRGFQSLNDRKLFLIWNWKSSCWSQLCSYNMWLTCMHVQVYIIYINIYINIYIVRWILKVYEREELIKKLTLSTFLSQRSFATYKIRKHSKWFQHCLIPGNLNGLRLKRHPRPHGLCVPLSISYWSKADH